MARDSTILAGQSAFAKSVNRQKSIPPAGVYVVAPCMEGPCKIGMADNLSRRLETLQCGCWEKLHVAFFGVFYYRDIYADLRACANRLEQKTHRNLRKCEHGLHGEWFSIGVRDAIVAIRKTAAASDIVEVTGETLAMQNPKTKGERIAYGLKAEIIDMIQKNEPIFAEGSAALTGSEGGARDGIIARGYARDGVIYL